MEIPHPCPVCGTEMVVVHETAGYRRWQCLSCGAEFCPVCSGSPVLLGHINQWRQWRCRNCGTEWRTLAPDVGGDAE